MEFDLVSLRNIRGKVEKFKKLFSNICDGWTCVCMCSVWFEMTATRHTGLIMECFTCWPLITLKQRSVFSVLCLLIKNTHPGEVMRTRYSHTCECSAEFLFWFVQFADVWRPVWDEWTLRRCWDFFWKCHLRWARQCGRLDFIWWEINIKRRITRTFLFDNLLWENYKNLLCS